MTSFDSKRSIDLITMGRLCVNLCSEQIGSRLLDAQSFRKYLGGCAGSIAVGASRLGLNTAIISCVGVDAMGEFLTETLLEEGVDITHVHHAEQHLTAMAIMGINPPDDFPIMYYRENCADMQLRPEHINKDLLKQARALLITGTSLSTPSMRETSIHAMHLATKQKTAVVFDLDFRPVLWKITHNTSSKSIDLAKKSITAAFQEVLPLCSLVVGTAREIKIAGGSENILEALETIRSLTDAAIIIETGDQGCEIYLDDLGHPQVYPGFHVEVLNILGAGDAFISGLVSGWLREMSWQECATRANACGAIAVTRHGGSIAIPTHVELEYFIDRYKTDPNLCYQNQINYIHARSVRAPKAERITLSVDHRWQFEQSCDDVGRAHTVIGAFKQQVLAGFVKVEQANPNLDLIISIDQEHGSEVLREANFLGVNINVPVEAAGSYPVRWIDERPIYEQILHRPANWGVKLHWKYHPQLEPQMRLRQLTQLQLLARVCDALQRRLEVELIIPGDHKSDAKYIAQSLEEVYAQNIFPDTWKVEPLKTITEWQMLHEVIQKYDPLAHLVMLAGNYRVYEDWREHFQLFRKTDFAGGFSIGRSVFWEPWQHFLVGSISLDDVPDLIADNFERYLEYWFDQMPVTV